MTASADLHIIANLAGQRLVSCAVEGMLLALLVCAVVRLASRNSSGTRFAIWFIALLSIAVMPFFSGAASGRWFGSTLSGITLPGSWAIYALGLWAVIATLGLMRIAAGLLHLRRLRRDARRLSLEDLPPPCQATLGEFDGGRTVAVCVSEEVRVPAATGFFRPAVMLPGWALEELTDSELNAVLLHELSHLGRWDDWTNLAQRLLGALFFFHPAVWWINSRLSLELEMACDDLVLARSGDARKYAECLVSVSEKSAMRKGLALATAAVGRARETAVRLARILDPTRVVSAQTSRPVCAATIVVSALALGIAMHTPALVGFSNGSLEVAQSTSPGTLVDRIPARRGSALRSDVVALNARYENEVPRAMVVKAAGKTNVVGFSQPPKIVRKASLKRRLISPTPKLIRASASQESVPTLLFVVQTQDFDATGMPIWNLCVWRVTVVPNQNQPVIHTEVLSKVI